MDVDKLCMGICVRDLCNFPNLNTIVMPNNSLQAEAQEIGKFSTWSGVVLPQKS